MTEVNGGHIYPGGVNNVYAGQQYKIAKEELLQPGQCREQFV